MCCCNGTPISELDPINVYFYITPHLGRYSMSMELDYGVSSGTIHGTLEEIRTHVQKTRDSANEALKQLDGFARKEDQK